MADNNKIEIKPELFDKVDETKKAFETYFRDNYKDLQNLYNKMCDSKDFKGQAVDGFLEIFDILLQYQSDIIETMPQLYESIKDFEQSLDEIKRERTYIGLEE